ncbi:hypothetical protein ACIPIA_04610 [Bosea sp. CER48]|uniref:hypothetical protein n=1 Tax=Bosea sp. CER48 TaxID=3377035 RepID=UPI003818DD3A
MARLLLSALVSGEPADSVVVGVALVAMCRTMAMTVVMLAMAVMIVIMAAATAFAMGMLVVLVLVSMIMAMVRVAVPMVMPMMMIVAVVVMVVPAAAIVAMGVVMHLGLRLERALDLSHRAALPAHQLRQSRMAGHVQCISGHFSGDVVAAEMPGQTHQTQRVLGANLEQAFQRSLDLHQAAVLQLQRIAGVQGRRLVEADREFEPALGRDGHAVNGAVAMTEAQRIDDAVGADGGLAKDGSGAKHKRRSHGLRPGAMRVSARIAA